jgi:hypothetical protein
MEQVIRHRGVGRDEDGKLIPGASDTPLMAIGVGPGFGPAPQSQKRVSDRREGEDIGAVVYFPPGTDLDDSTDELTVRGTRYRITVNDWQMQGRGGLEVVCVQGKG